MVFHSSRISLRRSPAVFQPVDSAAIFSASSTSAVLRASASARAASRAARASPAFSSATAASLSSRAARPSMSPTTCASSSEPRSRWMRGQRVARRRPHRSRAGPRCRSTSVTRSAKRRAKWARPSSGVPGLPGPDDPLALGRLDVDGAVRVDPSEGRPVAHLSILVLPAPPREVARRPPPQRSHCYSPGIVTGRIPRPTSSAYSSTVTIRAGRDRDAWGARYRYAVPLVAAAVCPHPPLLVPEVAGAAAHELDEATGGLRGRRRPASRRRRPARRRAGGRDRVTDRLRPATTRLAAPVRASTVDVALGAAGPAGAAAVAADPDDRGVAAAAGIPWDARCTVGMCGLDAAHAERGVLSGSARTVRPRTRGRCW